MASAILNQRNQKYREADFVVSFLFPSTKARYFRVPFSSSCAPPRHCPMSSPGAMCAFQRMVLSETEHTQVSLALMTAGQATRCREANC